jgi:hypothetical protein
MIVVKAAKVPDGAEFRRNGKVVQRACDVANGIASRDRRGEHRVYQRGQAHAVDQHGPCNFVTVSKPEGCHDYGNGFGVL